MGSGFKDFSAGDVLTASDVDGYLMRQGVMVFASTSARDTALSGNLEEGMFAFNTDADGLYYYDGSGWVPFSTPWTSFTPSWANVTLGSGSTEYWWYRYASGDLEVVGDTTLGTGGSFTGTVTLTLPNSETSLAGSYVAVPCGQVGLIDATGTDDLGGQVIVSGGATTVAFRTVTNAIVNGSAPFTWTNGDSLRTRFCVPL